jgi:hypothetical protein
MRMDWDPAGGQNNTYNEQIFSCDPTGTGVRLPAYMAKTLEGDIDIWYRPAGSGYSDYRDGWRTPDLVLSGIPNATSPACADVDRSGHDSLILSTDYSDTAFKVIPLTAKVNLDSGTMSVAAGPSQQIDYPDMQPQIPRWDDFRGIDAASVAFVTNQDTIYEHTTLGSWNADTAFTPDFLSIHYSIYDEAHLWTFFRGITTNTGGQVHKLDNSYILPNSFIWDPIQQNGNPAQYVSRGLM